MARVRRITATLRYHGKSWALSFNGLSVSSSKTGRKFISLHLHKKREQAATAQSVLEIVRGELARGVAFEDLGLFKSSDNGHALPVYTVAEMIGDYFKDRELHGVLEKTTLRQRRRSFAQWVTPSPKNALKYGPGIGARDARGVTDADIIALVGNIRSRRNRLGRTNSKGYAALVVREVSAVFAWARLKDAEGRTISNPCHGLGEYVRDRKGKRRVDAQGERVEKVRPFTQDDEAAFLAKAREVYGYDEWFFWLTLFRTGVRIGEGLALELADYKVDETKPHLHVHQTWSGDDLNPQRKNVEDVNVHPRIWPSYLDEARRFIRHRHQQNQQREQVVRWAFADEHGQPWPYATMHRHCRAILRAAELPHPTPHDTRHTFAVNLIDWTNDIDYVAQMLGDTLTVVVATYLKRQGARDKYERYAGIADTQQGAGSSRTLRTV